MKRINMLYAIYFNTKYNFIGQLFQGRYRAELIETDTYQLEISKYIHLNPVRAHMVEKPVDYPWSSYRHYAFGIDPTLEQQIIAKLAKTVPLD